MEQDKERITLQKIEQYAFSLEGCVLEVGCGDGRVTALLAEKAETVIAIEPDDERIAFAKNTIETVRFIRGAGEYLGFRNDSFDLVLFTLSLHHQASDDALREAHRVLRKRGQLIIIEPTEYGEIERLSYPYSDERPRLKKARSSIDRCEFVMEAKEIFYTSWIFYNLQELFDYYFDYYEMSFQEAIVDELRTILGEKANDSPLILSDELVIYSLRKI